MSTKTLRRAATALAALSILAFVGLVVCAFAAIWTVDPEVSGRFTSTAFVCFFVGVIPGGIAAGLYAEAAS